MPFLSLNDIARAFGSLEGKTVLVRADLNVPMRDGRVSDETRLRSIEPTIAVLRAQGARVLLLTHFGRPEGKLVDEFSLKHIVEPLAVVLGEPIGFATDCVGDAVSAALAGPEQIILLENLRFHPGEEADDDAFAKALAKHGDIYVNDAFSAAHRAHASTHGITKHIPSFCGLGMLRELDALTRALGDPKRPVAAIVGGSKVSTKLDVLTNLVQRVDHLIIGGGMANTFLFAKGIGVGASLCETSLSETAQSILARAEETGTTVHLPYDVVVAKALKPNIATRTINIHDVADDDMILDVGPSSVEALGDVLKTCRTLIWNGPLGAFETPPFDQGTVALAQTAAALGAGGDLLSVAGGGDTVAALAHAGVVERFGHVSTAGGAFLEWMEGRELPGVKALEEQAA
ncbi:MAG: phosphoglycerate kinase [Pseudomonadota bacterium]